MSTRTVRSVLTAFLAALFALSPVSSALALELSPSASASLSLSVPLVGSVSADIQGNFVLDVPINDLVGSAAEDLQWGQTGGTTATPAHVAQVIGADRLRARGLTGAGVGVALIDTGVAPVEGLTDVWQGPDLSLESQDTQAYQVDGYGHGTHLAGLITSDRPDAMGIAPDSTLISIKTAARNGAVDVSQAIAAIDWVVQNRTEHNIRVLVLAYGTNGTQDPANDPLAHAVQVAWRNGIVVVIAAGNDGDNVDAVVNPATDPYVITVGATDTRGTGSSLDDFVPSFSAPGTPARRPDILAPGAGVVSARVPGGYLDTLYPQARRDGDLFRGNGTSQSSAIVGGAVALLLQNNPSLTPDQVKARLLDRGLLGNLLGGDIPELNLTRAIRSNANTVQRHPVSTGTGSLDLARGTHHLAVGDVRLDGEVDVHGRAFDTAAWAAQAETGATWSNGVWNATQWTGASWTGQSWNGYAWNGYAWNGYAWNGYAWNGYAWNGYAWNGYAWA